MSKTWVTPNAIRDLMQEAKSLKSEDGENPEYDRALCELIGSLIAKPRETVGYAARRVAKSIGISFDRLNTL